MLLSQKIFVAMFLWTIAAVLVSLSAGIEVLVTLELIGLLIVRELTDSFLSSELKQRMDVFIYGGLLLFVVIVLHRVWTIIS